MAAGRRTRHPPCWLLFGLLLLRASIGLGGRLGAQLNRRPPGAFGPRAAITARLPGNGAAPSKERMARLAQRLRDRRLGRLVSTLHEARAQHPLDAHHYDLLQGELRRHRAWRESIRTVEYVERYDPTALRNGQVRSALGACAAARAHGCALPLVNLLLNSTLTVERKTLNAAIRCCAAAGEGAEALWVLRTAIPRAGLRPDARSYSAAITALGAVPDADGALSLLRESRAAPLAAGEDPLVDTHVYAAAMTACTRDGRPQAAIHLFETMHIDGLRPDAICFGAALGACNRLGQASGA